MEYDDLTAPNPEAIQHGVRATIGVAAALGDDVSVSLATEAGNRAGLNSAPYRARPTAALHVTEGCPVEVVRLADGTVSVCLGANSVDMVILPPGVAARLSDLLAGVLCESLLGVA